MSTSARGNYSGEQRTSSNRFHANSGSKFERNAFGTAATTRRNEVNRSPRKNYEGLDATSRTMVVKMQFENVTDTVRIDNASQRSCDLPRRRNIHEIPSLKSEASEKPASFHRSPVNSNELEDSRRDDKHRDNNLTIEGSADVNLSRPTASSAKPIDRNHRTVTTTSSLATVTATKTQLPSRLSALREDLPTTQDRAEADTVDSSDQKGDRTRAARRRRRAAAHANETSESNTNQSTFTQKQAAKTPISSSRKFSPYPNYIQPVIESPTYRREVNRILSHDTRSNPYNRRNRKISTDMNRYESSSSSDSDDDIHSPPVTSPQPQMISRLKTASVETPDNSDTESRAGRRTRRSRKPATRMLVPPSLDDEYGMSLPANYKQPEEFSSVNSPRVCDVKTAPRGNNRGHSDETALVVSPKDKPGDQPASSGIGRRNRRAQNQLIINKGEVGQNREEFSPSRSTDISISTPDLAKVDGQTSGKNRIGSVGVYRNSNEKCDDAVSSAKESNQYEIIQSMPKIAARKVGEDFWPRDEDTLRLLAHTSTTSGRSESPEAKVDGGSAASCAIQDTIDQLQSFAEEPNRHRNENSSGTASPLNAASRKGSSKCSSSSKTTSPHLSSSETLKDCDYSGDYRDKHSRSTSFDSVASNPESGRVVTRRSLSNKERNSRTEHTIKSQGKAASVNDISPPWQEGTTNLQKLHHLTEAMKNIKMPQPLNTQEQTQTDPITVLTSPGSISSSQSKLETLNEYPEPSSPATRKRPKKGTGISKSKSPEPLEIDEGVVTDDWQHGDSKDCLNFEHYAGKPVTRIGHQMRQNPRNEDIGSSRSTSDPSAERKRSKVPHKSTENSLNSVMHHKHDIGSSGHSLGGSSQLSEQPSSFSDTLNIEELIREEQQDELKRSQAKERLKKKSKSDPNPEGAVTLDPDTRKAEKDSGYISLGTALSEPNVVEKTDALGPLEHPVPDGLRVRVAPTRRRGGIISPYQASAPSNNRSDSSSLESESSSPVQKRGDEILSRESEEFEKVFKGMKNGDGRMGHSAAEHTRSSSEPVENIDYSNSSTFSGLFGYGGSAMSLSKQQIPRQNNSSSPDKRLHVFENLLETERSYVNSLRILCRDYMTPLMHVDKHATCEGEYVKEIFYKIPELLTHHERFYDNVQKCHDNWNFGVTKVGELFLNSFNKDALLDTYTAYITHYNAALEAVTKANAKEAFRRFLEQCRVENKEKHGLSDLMIKPVQRIPRYELLIKDMLKHTPASHPDREGLLNAQEEIHKVAEHMNRSEKQDRLLSELEQLIEGLSDLCVSKRRFLRQDIVTEVASGSTKKDRSLWLFSDLIVCSTRKSRGSAAFRRGSMINLYQGPDRMPYIELGYKYKFLWKFPLEDVDNTGNATLSRSNIERQCKSLQTDRENLTSIQDLVSKLTTSHSQLDEAVRDLISHVEQNLVQEKYSLSLLNTPPRLNLSVRTGDGPKSFLFDFNGDDKGAMAQFEKLFASAKATLTSMKSQGEPGFVKAIPIDRSGSRSGMQFSCATSNVDSTLDSREVWVCNTDGIVGQIFILSMEPEPNQTHSFKVCDSRICCIAHVPINEKRTLLHAEQLLAMDERHNFSGKLPPVIMSWDDDDGEDSDETSSTRSTHSNLSSPHNSSPLNPLNGELAFNSEYTIGNGVKGDNGRMDGAFRIRNDGTALHGSLDDLLQEGAETHTGVDAMWLGTDEGRIYIFPSSQSTRTSKPNKLSLNASVHNILYHNGQVFVSLSNGELLSYMKDDKTGHWDLDNPITKSEKSPRAITKMLVVGDKELWCGCQNAIKILDTRDLSDIDTIVVSNDAKRQVFCMVNSGCGVCVALDKRPQIKVYHTTTHNMLGDIDVSHLVNKMLAGADAIIRQHKAACLRITALLVSKSTLWCGTSAGVVLTIPMPKITYETSSLATPIIPQGLTYGHTGHVRFLASVEITGKEQGILSRGGSRRASSKHRSSSSSASANATKPISIIVSGGDGYEDFRMTAANESAGREDSINHLLVWRA